MAIEPITRAEQIMSGESLEPITREEMFLAKAAGMDVNTPEPITRREMFLSKISGGGSGPAESVIGTWVFNDDPDLSTMPPGANVSFISGGVEFNSISRNTIGSSSWGIYAISYSGSAVTIGGVYANNPSGNYGITHGWKDEVYKTITIIEEPAGQDFANWLKANATKQDEATEADYQAALAEMGVDV